MKTQVSKFLKSVLAAFVRLFGKILVNKAEQHLDKNQVPLRNVGDKESKKTKKQE